MKSGPFIELVAKTLGVEPGTARLIARALREDGFLTTGARGVNAPDMTPLDAARLVLALMAGAPPSRVLTKFHVLRSLELQADPPPEAEKLAACVGARLNETAEEFLASILDALVKDRETFTVWLEDGGVIPLSMAVNDTYNSIVFSLRDLSASFLDFPRFRRSAALRKKMGGVENWTDEEIKAATFDLKGIVTTRQIEGHVFLFIADGLADRKTELPSPAVVYSWSSIDG